MSGMFDGGRLPSAAAAGANVTERAQLPPSLAISTVIFALTPDRGRGGAAKGRPALWIPLVRRVKEPFKGRWALPGGPLTSTESLEDAARRNLKETTGLSPEYLEQLYAFGGLNRSSRPEHGSQRVVSIVYWALVRPTEAELLDGGAGQAGTGETGAGGETGEAGAGEAGPGAANVRWHPADTAGAAEGGLAFDHREIIDYALWRLRSKLEYAQIAYHFLGETFTLAQLREVYEAILGKPLDPANFRRQLKATAEIEPTDQVLEGGRHRPPRLYRYTGARGTLDATTAPPRRAGPPAGAPIPRSTTDPHASTRSTA